MADLVITAATVVAGTSSRSGAGTAGATITAGQVVYLDPADNKYKLADNNSATAAARSPAGIALHGAANGQPLTFLTQGPITIGAAVTAGVGYYLSDAPGGICPVADLLAGEYPTFLGFATSATVIDVGMKESGVALA